jgi:hypothetical protein
MEGTYAQQYLEAFRKERKLPASINRHVDAALRSLKEPIPIFRTLEAWTVPKSAIPTYAQVSALGCNALSIVNCHNGQRKLTLSVLEFVCVALERLECKASDMVVVYAGASGLAVTIAAKLFPDLRFILYDPAPNTTALLDPSFKDVVVYTTKASADAGMHSWTTGKQVTVCTGDAGWFNDDVAAALKTVTKRSKHVAFISDVRVSNDEESIVKDMLNQQRWTGLLGATAYMFKFRVPYDEKLVSRYDVHGKKGGDGKLPYLDGSLYIQLYPRPTTAELRLIGFRVSPSRYRLRIYDVREIEGKMALFNLVYRSNARFSWSKEASTYEAVAETSILDAVKRASGRKSLIEVRGIMDAAMSKFIRDKSSMEACAVATSRKQGCRNPAAIARIAAISHILSPT